MEVSFIHKQLLNNLINCQICYKFPSVQEQSTEGRMLSVQGSLWMIGLLFVGFNQQPRRFK